jgi:Fe2+ transport system protein FeoA
MEKDFQEREEAWACFIAVISLDDVTVARLRELGFVGA